jgi:glycosyltransferase involved in cell wall biosynthesis
MPRVSVLTTVFNDEDFIKISINSALTQSIDDIEVVVINDGSDDGTTVILDEFSDSRLRVFHCDRMGRGRALNYGLQQCASPYVAILDADDVALPRRLELQADFLDGHPEVALVGSRYRSFIDGDGRPLANENLLPVDYDDVLAMLRQGRHPFFHSSVAFRKDVVAALGGYHENLYGYEDLELYAKLAPRFVIVNLDERLSLKRVHSEQYFAGSEGVIYTPEGRKALSEVVELISRTVGEKPS